MRRFERPAGGVLHVNDAEDAVVAVPGASISDKARATLSSLLHLSVADGHGTGPTAAPSGEMMALARELMEERAAGPFLLSPMAFTRQGDERFSYPVTAALLSVCPLGVSLRSELEGTGLFGFADRLKNPSARKGYRAALDLLLASLSLSTHGATKASDITAVAFRCWLSSYRTPDGLRWRGELWGASRDIHFQCLR